MYLSLKNKKSPTLRSLATESVRLVITRKDFHGDNLA
uniref:Uncharacterized protein n=1 Tax=Siphoviridae sp. ctkTc5 TaxID=2827922 RepID=A0A8S5SLH4_9CAUD|nr:MAG TPA: hypothetical protein [Siphoviridae sp. ctkTc5]